MIAYNAVGPFRENRSLLIGRSPGSAYPTVMERLARSVPGVPGVHDLRAAYGGPNRVHAGLQLGVARGTPVEEADPIAGEVQQRIHHGTDPGFCFIKVGPVAPEQSRLPSGDQGAA